MGTHFGPTICQLYRGCPFFRGEVYKHYRKVHFGASECPLKGGQFYCVVYLVYPLIQVPLDINPKFKNITAQLA